MKSVCVICSKEFPQVNGSNVCGDKCRLERKRRYARLVSAVNHRRNSAIRTSQKSARVDRLRRSDG